MGETVVVTQVWEEQMLEAVHSLMNQPHIKNSISEEHFSDTPRRVVESFQEYFSGFKFDPEEILRKGFEPGSYDEMVYVKNIDFVSFCCHHLSPFIGMVHFAYLPGRQIVGLSKIPRLVEVYSHRPQVQEKLTAEIADTFQKVVKPRGCGVVIEAVHLCMMIRGVRKENATTRTTALRGVFLQESAKMEFLNGINSPGYTLGRRG